DRISGIKVALPVNQFVGRNAATVNGQPRPKKIKTIAELYQHDHLTLTKIKNEYETQTENTRASSKSKLLDRKSCEEVKMPVKKRKLKDQDTPPYASTVKEKRLKTSNTNINGKEKPLIKGNGMKVKLPVSRESSVDKSHEKNLNATSTRKDLESERFQFGATSSSSKVSGSLRRASLQEVKGSPVGSVSLSLLKAPNLDKVSPAAAGRTLPRKSHAKSSIRPEVPRKLLAREDNMESRDIDASQIQKLGSVSLSLLKAPNLDKVSPAAAGRTLPRKSHAKSSIRPEVPRKKLKGMVDPLSVYSTAAKLSNLRLFVWYKGSILYTNNLTLAGESPSSSTSHLDNLNNKATMMHKTMLSKNITHLGNQVVALIQANFTRLLDFTGDVNLAMEASLNTQNAYKAASATLEKSQNEEMAVLVKQVVDFNFQDVQELVTLVKNAREAIRQ
nr:cullin, conserved site-containing protein [Tanacetum cinerariifolium]